MAGYSFGPKAPRGGFQIAQGLANAVSQYAKGRMQAAQMAALNEQRMGMSQYRMAQAELARQRSIPADFQKIQLMRTLANGGMLDPSTVKNFEKQYVPQILAKMRPEEVAAAQQRFEQDANQGKLSPEFNQFMTMNPSEEKLMSSYNMADAGMGRAQIGAEASKYNAELRLKGEMQRAANAKDKADQDRIVHAATERYKADIGLKAAKVRGDATTGAAGIRAGAQVESAGIHAKATTGAAQIRANAPGKSGTVQDPYTKALLQQQKDAEKQIGDLNNPKGPFGAMGPEKDKLIQHYEQLRQDAIQKLQQHNGGQSQGAQAPQTSPNSPQVYGPAAPLGPNVIPYDPTAAASAKAGAFMKHPEKGWVQKSDSGAWLPAQDPGAQRNPQGAAVPMPAMGTGQQMYQSQPQTPSDQLQVEPIGAK